MGRGNTCVHGPYEGPFFVDNDDYVVYRESGDVCGEAEPEVRLQRDLNYSELTGPNWLYDDWGTGEEWDDIKECLIDSIIRRFRSFTRPQKETWLDRTENVLLENRLFYIVEEDNEWSMAIKLRQKDSPYGENLEGLQSHHYLSYLEGIKASLLERLPEIGLYNGPWTHKVLTREAYAQQLAAAKC